MAGITRVNPTAVARGTIQKNTSTTMYKVVLSNAGLAVMATDAAAASVTDAIGSFSGLFQVKADGSELYAVADRHAVGLNAIATLIAKVLDTGTFTVSGGVATLSDSQTVTVTEVTDFEAI